MSKAAKPAKADKTSGKQAQGKQAMRDAHGAKPRNPVVDFMVFIGGVGSLVYVFNTIAPNLAHRGLACATPPVGVKGRLQYRWRLP